MPIPNGRLTESEEDAILARMVAERRPHYRDGVTRVEGLEAVQAFLDALKTRRGGSLPEHDGP